jgi:hypothetical protein
MVTTNRSAARVGVAGGGFGVHPYGSGHLEATPARSLDQGFTEFLSEPELRSVRRVWWRLRAAGVDLPAERHVIAVNGGAR